MNTNIILIGRTGDGKSAVGNLIARTLQYPHMTPFVEGNSANSITTEPSAITYANYTIVDTPGLMDTGGVGQDAINIQHVVDRSRNLGYFNALILLFNYEAPRFDSGMQDALKLNIDSFGRESLNNLGVLYTRCPDLDQQERVDMTNHIQSIVAQINHRCQVNLRTLPFWYVDCHPEAYLRREVPQEIVNQYAQNSQQQIRDLLVWAHAKPRYSTENAIYGEYDHIRARREAEERAVREQALREAETERRIAAQNNEAEERQAREVAERQRGDAEAERESARRALEEVVVMRERAQTQANEEQRRLELEIVRKESAEIAARNIQPQHIYINQGGGGGMCTIM